MSHRLPENVGFPLVSKVEPDLSIVPFKGVEVRSWRLVLELVVDLLVKHQRLSVHVKYSDVVGSLEVVLDEANYTTGPFVPSVTVTRPLTSVHLTQSLFILQLVTNAPMNGQLYHIGRDDVDGGVNTGALPEW